MYKNNNELRQDLMDRGNEDTVMFENPDYASAAIGITEDGNLVYSYPLMVEHLMKTDNMTEEDAVDFISFNTIRAIPYCNEGKPPIVFHPFEEMGLGGLG